MIFFAVFSTILAVIGIVLTFYFGRKTLKLEKEKITLDWEDVEIATTDLSSSIKEKFKPDIIFIPDMKDGTIGHMIKSYLSTESFTIPIMVGILVWKNVPEKSEIPEFIKPSYDNCETKKWRAYIPKEIIKYKEKKVLIIDDYVLSGDFAGELRQWFRTNGFEENNIKFASIITTSVANADANAPDFFWKETETLNFYFPWGKGR
jgi:hypoxanthine phosphoribosyltransferase